MQSLKFVAVRCERIEEPLLVKALSQVYIPAFPCHTVEVGYDLAHAAVFHAENALHLLLAKRIAPAPYPLRHLLDRRQRLLVASEGVHIEKACHDFMDGVERGPDIHSVTQTVE